MTGVKAQELSHDEWYALLEPYGYANITVRAPAVMFRVPPSLLDWEIRVMLKPSPGHELGEWAERSYLLEQARQAVEAVKAAGYWLPDAPRVEFGGRYRFRVDRGTVPEWDAEAELRFDVRASRRCGT